MDGTEFSVFIRSKASQSAFIIWPGRYQLNCLFCRQARHDILYWLSTFFSKIKLKNMKKTIFILMLTAATLAAKYGNGQARTAGINGVLLRPSAPVRVQLRQVSL